MDLVMSRCRRFASIVAVVGALAVGISPTSGVAKQVERAASSVEFDASGLDGRTINRTFEAVVEDGNRLLLRKEIDQRFAADYAQGPGRVRIDAWRLPRSRGDKPIYTIADQADEVGWLAHGLLTTGVRACCESRGSRAVFNAQTGRLLLYANGRDDSHLAMVFGEGVILMFGVLDEHGGRHPGALPPHQDDRMSLLVSEADSSSCRRQLLFDLPARPRFHTWVRSVTWKNLKAERVNGLRVHLAHGKTLSGTLEIGISDERQITIPAGERGLDTSQVVLPPDGKMKVVSPCIP